VAFRKFAPITLKERLTLLSACWQWGIEQGVVENNPWSDLPNQVKVPPKQKAKPFTKKEIGAIVAAFRNDRYYYRYADYVEFLFSTGCRTAEAIGLRWKHLSDDCSTVWIGESLSRGTRKFTKTNRARTIALTPRLQSLLLERRPSNYDADGLVFTSPKGKAIDDCNFRSRAWITILARLGIDYRVVLSNCC
jgi:integrase